MPWDSTGADFLLDTDLQFYFLLHKRPSLLFIALKRQKPTKPCLLYMLHISHFADDQWPILSTAAAVSDWSIIEDYAVLRICLGIWILACCVLWERTAYRWDSKNAVSDTNRPSCGILRHGSDISFGTAQGVRCCWHRGPLARELLSILTGSAGLPAAGRKKSLKRSLGGDAVIESSSHGCGWIWFNAIRHGNECYVLYVRQCCYVRHSTTGHSTLLMCHCEA